MILKIVFLFVLMVVVIFATVMLQIEVEKGRKINEEMLMQEYPAIEGFEYGTMGSRYCIAPGITMVDEINFYTCLSVTHKNISRTYIQNLQDFKTNPPPWQEQKPGLYGCELIFTKGKHFLCDSEKCIMKHEDHCTTYTIHEGNIDKSCNVTADKGATVECLGDGKIKVLIPTNIGSLVGISEASPETAREWDVTVTFPEENK